MNNFEYILSQVLSEMPVRHFMPAGNRYEGPTSAYANYAVFPLSVSVSYQSLLLV
jgi:hypothetical protein